MLLKLGELWDCGVYSVIIINLLTRCYWFVWREVPEPDWDVGLGREVLRESRQEWDPSLARGKGNRVKSPCFLWSYLFWEMKRPSSPDLHVQRGRINYSITHLSQGSNEGLKHGKNHTQDPEHHPSPGECEEETTHPQTSCPSHAPHHPGMSQPRVLPSSQPPRQAAPGASTPFPK